MIHTANMVQLFYSHFHPPTQWIIITQAIALLFVRFEWNSVGERERALQDQTRFEDT